MVVSYAEGTTINLQEAARDLDARILAIEALHDAVVSLENGSADFGAKVELFEARVKALEDEIALLRAALEPKS